MLGYRIGLAAALWALTFLTAAGAKERDSAVVTAMAPAWEGDPQSAESVYSGVDAGTGTGIGGSGPGLDRTLELPSVTVRRRRTEAQYRGMEEGLRFSAAQAARAVSALGDPSRFVQTLPGVGRASDWETSLIVRGGSPDQTVFLLDGVPMARVSHYEGMRGEHGGSGMLNLEFVEDITFHRGTFPARLPDRMSGAVELRYRDGDHRTTSTRAAADVTGVGGSTEGPLPDISEGGSYATSFRYSALDLLVNSGAVEAFGSPRYWNGQARIHIPSGSSALRINAVGGSETWYNAIGRSAMLGLEGHAVSLSLDWQNHSGGLWTRAALILQDHAQATDFRILRMPGRPGADSLTHFESGAERRYGAILEHSLAVSPNLTLRFGGSEDLVLRRRRLGFGDQATYLPYADTVIDHTQSLNMYSRPFSEAAAYGEASLRTGSWEWYAGYRHFYEELSDDHGPGPRLAAVYRPARRHSLRAAFGMHTQPHEYAEVERHGGIPRLPSTAQGSLSWEWRPTEATTLSLEGFAKEGSRLSRPRMIREGETYREVFLDTGRTRGRGFEAFFCRPRGGRFAYSAAYTFLHHRERSGAGVWEPGPQSVPHRFNVAGEVLIPAGFHLGLRYSVAAGTPYTPFDMRASERAGTGVYDPDRAWREQGPRFERLDLRLESARRIGAMRVSVYGEIGNLLDRGNTFGMRWNPVEGRPMPVEGMGRLPVAGLALAF